MPTHPLDLTIRRLRAVAAATGPHRRRTKESYRAAVPPRDRAWFERAWAVLRRRGELVPDCSAPRYRARRYVAAR